MEWSRAKTILIFAFLLLNLLLAYQLWIGSLDKGQAAANDVNFSEEIRQLMEERNIRIDAQIPKETPKLQEITVAFDRKFDPNIKIRLAQPFRSDLLFRDGGAAAELGRQVFAADAYQLDPADSDADHYVLHQTVDHYPMFEVNLELDTSQGMVVGYRQQYADILPGTADKAQKVLAATTAVGTLVENNYLPLDSVITDVRLGFHGQLFDSETQVLAPYWRVTTKRGEVFYVHAITGAVAAPQKEK
ncbi:MAG TPA: two-component system regulatory protein YycI [Bacilli bacterium]